MPLDRSSQQSNLRPDLGKNSLFREDISPENSCN